MPMAGKDRVICVGRESIEALATGEPVRVGDGEYLLMADSYDYPYRRIAELEALLRRIDNVTQWETHPLGRSFQEEIEAALGIGEKR